MNRAITAPELAILRSEGQFTKLRLAVITPDVVFAARTNGVPSTNDGVNSIVFNNISYGTVGAVVAGMTVWVGSTSGAMDIGTVRALSATLTSGSITSGSASTGTMTIGLTSELAWTDGAFITVADEFLLWPKQAQFEGGVFLVNDGQTYTNQHSVTPPAVIMGPDLILNMGSGSSISHTVDSSASWVPPGATVTIGANPATWSVTSASGSASISGSAGAHQQTITFYTPGNYRLTCEIAAGAATGIGHRLVYVYNDAAPLTTQFTLDTINGDWSTGGWNFDVTMYGETDLNTIRDRSRIFLIADDYYASGSAIIHQSVGPVTGQEHVLCNGWIDGETINWNPELSTVKFKVHGPQWWLANTASRQTMILNCNSLIGNVHTTPAQWNEMSSMTYDNYLWHVLKWRSTCIEVMDVFKSSDTRIMLGATGPVGTLWGQITQVGEAQQMIHPCCNRFGQLYAQIDLNTQFAAARAAAPVVMEVSKADWRETVEIERRIVDDVGWQEVTAFSVNGTTLTAFRAGSYGTWLGHYGKTDRRTELLVSVAGGQTETNTIAGILCGNANNDYPRMTIPLGSSNRFFDICPNQYGTISMDAADTPLGLTLTNKKFVPKTISMQHDPETGVLAVDLSCEGESSIKQGFFLPNPQVSPPKVPPGIPTNPWKPGVIIRPPGPVLCTNTSAKPTGPFPLPVNVTIQSAGGGVSYYDQPIHCKIRAGAAVNPTKVSVVYTAYTSVASGSVPTWSPTAAVVNMEVWALDVSGSPVLQAAAVAYTGPATGLREFVFSPAAATEIGGIRFIAKVTT